MNTVNTCKKDGFLCFIVASLFICGQLFGQKTADFILPVDTPVHLAGTFGELRAAHFHTGLDFRTGGDEGKSVCASLDGWVSRIKVSTIGFGKVLYIDHPQGFTTVYAHLHNFTGGLDAYIDSAQNAAGKYEVELFPDSGRFQFVAGELIGLSGNTGGSEGPHLHFEIRKRADQIPLNPLDYLPVKDTVRPVIEELMAYEVKGRHYDQILRTTVSKLKQKKRSTLEVTTSSYPDTIAFSAYMLDSDPPNGLGIYSAELIADQQTIFSYSFDSLNFDDGRFANAHAVVPSGGIRFHRLHRLPGNKAASFKTKGDGRLVVKDDQPIACRIITKDKFYNTDTLLFTLIVKREKELSGGNYAGGSAVRYQLLSFDSAHTLTTSRGISQLKIPAGAAYQDFNVAIQSVRVSDPLIAETVELLLDQDEAPFHRPATLTIQLFSDSLKKTDLSKLVVAGRNDLFSPVRDAIIPETVTEESLTCSIRRDGVYSVQIDSTPPFVKECNRWIDPVDGKLYERVIVADDLAGVGDFSVLHNGKLVIAIWDPRDRSVSWKVTDEVQLPGYTEIKLQDKVKNESFFRLYY